MTHVAYRGGAPAAQDLIGGQIPLMVDTASETLEHHKAGKVRIVAVTKTFPPEAIAAVAAAGCACIGENYAQELVDKWGRFMAEFRN